MNLKHVALPILVATALLIVQLPGAPGHLHAAQQEIPVSYVCIMDAEVLEDKPGTCRICKMDLVPVHIDTAWSCPNHAAIIRDKAGACPIDKRELVQVIVAKHFSCAEKPNQYLAEAGKCADGSERKLVTELRAHGDHNPRHGGSFFMAEDKWHHLEGTYPSAGLFRAFFYDNFTKPLSPKSFTGTVVIDENGKDGASFPLTLARNGQTLEARITNAPAAVDRQAGEARREGQVRPEDRRATIRFRVRRRLEGASVCAGEYHHQERDAGHACCETACRGQRRPPQRQPPRAQPHRRRRPLRLQ